MSVYVVQLHCPDYYCGCGGGHIAGVYTTEKQAEQHHPDRGFGRTVTKVDLDEPFELRPTGETWT